jgi:hypothetical protein
MTILTDTLVEKGTINMTYNSQSYIYIYICRVHVAYMRNTNNQTANLHQRKVFMNSHDC